MVLLQAVSYKKGFAELCAPTLAQSHPSALASGSLSVELQRIGAKANEQGKFPEGSLNWGDYYSVVKAVLDLQGMPLPPYLKDKDEFARKASEGRAVDAWNSNLGG